MLQLLLVVAAVVAFVLTAGPVGFASLKRKPAKKRAASRPRVEDPGDEDPEAMDPEDEAEEDEDEEEMEDGEEEDDEAEDEDEMDEDEDEDKSEATAANVVRDLKTALPSASADFREACLLNGLTVSQAKGMYAACGQKPEPKPEKPAKRKGGPGISDGAKEPAKASGDFMDMARRMKAEKSISLTEAMKRVAKEHPEAHAEYIDNQPQTRRRR